MYLRQTLRLGRWPLLFILPVLLCVLAGASGQEAIAEPFEVKDFPAASDRIDQAWTSAREAIHSGDIKQAGLFLDQVLETKWDHGIRDLPLYSAAILSLAQESNFAKDDKEIMLSYSRDLSPNRVSAAFARARFYFKNDAFSQSGLIIDELSRAGENFIEDLDAIRRAIGLAGFSAIIAVFISFALFGTIMLARYFRLFIHDIRGIFQQDIIPGWMKTVVPVLLLLLPLFFGASYWLLPLLWIVFMAAYMGNAERVVASILLLLFFSVPFFFNIYSASLAACDKEKIIAVSHVRNGIYSDEDLELLYETVDRESDDLASLLSLALVNKRLCNFREAADYYIKARKIPEYQDISYNNLGNLYLVVGQIDDSVNAYKKAISYNPQRVEPVYNMSQAYYELRDFEKQDELYRRAERISKDKVNEFDRLKNTRNINRTVIDIPVPARLLAGEMLKQDANLEKIRKQMWDSLFGLLSPETFPLVSVAAILLLWAAWLAARKLQISYACSSCGRPICQRCNPPSKNPDICATCYSALYAHGGLDPKMRMEKMRSARIYRIWTKNIGLVATLVLPGSGQIFKGRTITGTVLMIISSIILGFIFAPRWLWSIEVSGAVLSVAPALIFKAALYVVVIMVAFVHYYLTMREEA